VKVKIKKKDAQRISELLSVKITNVYKIIHGNLKNIYKFNFIYIYIYIYREREREREREIGKVNKRKRN
jgi:hypothetical protein